MNKENSMKKVLALLLAFMIPFLGMSVSAKDINVSFTEAEMGNWTVSSISNWSGNALVTDDGFLKITHLNPTNGGQALRPSVSLRYNPGATLVNGAAYTVKYDYKGANISGGQQLLFNVGTNKISVKFKSNKADEAYEDEVKDVSEFGYRNGSFWAAHSEDYTFTVTDIRDSEGNRLSSVATGNMYIKVNSNGRNDAVNYDDVAFYLGNFSITEKLPEGYDPGGEEIADPAYNKVQTIVDEDFSGENPFANWSNVINGSGIRTLDDSALSVAPAEVQSRVRFEKQLTIKRGAVYTVSYKVKATSTASWLFGIEASDPFNGTSTAMYDNSLRNVGAMSTAWQQVSYSFRASPSMETPSTKTVAVFFLFTSAADKVWIDDFKIVETIYPELPVIESGFVRGASMADGTVFADCAVSDADGVLKDIAYTWQLSDDNESWTDVSNEKDYTLPSDSEGKYIRFKAQPSSKATNKKCDEFVSDSKKIASKRAVPVISDLKINASDGKYSVSYTYESEYAEGETTVLWQYSKDKETWTTIRGANGKTFTADGTGAGQYVRALVIPTDADGVEGKEYYTGGGETLPAEIEFFVAADGSDENAGTINAPFATPEGARSKVRSLIANGDAENCDITVYIRGGEYYRDSAFTLTSEDSGSKAHPVTYAAYNGERVIFTGGKTVPADEVKRVTDDAVLGRIYDSTARAKLLSVDLGKYYSEIPEIPEYSHDNDAKGNGTAIFRTQVRPVVNGQSLKRAQWPNEDEDELKITAVSDDKTTLTLEKNISEHTSRWADISGVRAVGHMTSGATWTYQDYVISSADGNTVTMPAKENYYPQQDGLFRFYDILEEIDCPGESYIDTKTKTLYFYPYGGEAPEVVLPVSESQLLLVNGASNISIEGIDFECVRNAPFALYNSPENVTLKNCSFKHFNAMCSIDGANNTLDGCFAYDGAVGFVSVNGGDSKTVTKANNTLKNSIFRECDVMKRAYGHTVILNGFGNIIQGCDIGDADGDLIATNGMGHRITGNKIHNGTRWTGDMGSIYLGRTPVSIGLEIDHNYFYSHASKFANGWAQAIFADDGAISPYIHDNVFYQATLPTSMGGQNFSIKTHGGQYMRVSNNIFVDNPFAVQFQTWSTTAEMQPYYTKNWQEIRWFLLLFDKYSSNLGWKASLINNGIVDENFKVSDAWKNYCKDTEWEPYIELLECGFWDEAKDLDPNVPEQYEQLKKLAAKYAPNYTNSFTNNAVFEGASSSTGVHEWSKAIDENNYVSLSAKGVFENYGTDFTVTEAGLEKIRRAAPDFRAVDFSAIGSSSLTDGGKPIVSSAYITVKDGIPSLSYDYSGAPEGLSKVDWYVSNAENGSFEKLLGKHDTSLPGDFGGKYIYAEITPVSENGARGEKFTTETVKADSDLTIGSLISALAASAGKLESAVGIGSGFADAPETAHEALKAAIAAASAAKSESEKYEAYEKLLAALDDFKASVNTKPEGIESGKTYTILPFMGELDISVPENIENVSVRLPSGEALQKLQLSGFVTIDGTKYSAVLNIAEGTAITADSDFVTVSVFGASKSATVAPANADSEKITAVKLTDKAYALSKAASFVIENAPKSKLVGFIENGRFVSVTKSAADISDISENVRISGADGIGLGLVKLSEQVIYERAKQNEPDSDQPGGGGGTGGGGNSGGNPYGNKTAGNGFYSGGTTSPNLEAEFCFDDVKNHWAKAFIMKMYSAGIVSGVTEKLFEPDRAVTRAEFAALIARTLKLSETSGNKFSDVESGSWYEPSVNACADAGIISGFGGKFRPDDTITRFEMAVVISNAYANLGKTEKTGGIEKFSDKENMPEWAKPAVDLCVSAAIVSGMTDDTFGGESTATRAQAAVVLSKLITG